MRTGLSPEARSLIASTQAVGEDEEGAASASVSVPKCTHAVGKFEPFHMAEPLKTFIRAIE